MFQPIGLQYTKDQSIDKTGFLAKARLHQSKYRATQLNVPFDTYGNYLSKPDAAIGLNFYEDFDIFKVVKKRYPNYNKQLLANMLRSEHIAFNLIIPLNRDKTYCKKVFNQLLSGQIQSINKIKVEYAPSPSLKYLNDKTSFDIYIEYTHIDQRKGIIGIEVKYTEQSYPLKSNSKEAEMVADKNSIYYTTSTKSQLYQPNASDLLPTDTFRQIWRNQLLGESMLLIKNSAFRHFTSLTIFPAANIHFIEASKAYMGLLINNKDRFVPVTYETFITACRFFAPNDRFRKWIDYLEERYIIV